MSKFHFMTRLKSLSYFGNVVRWHKVLNCEQSEKSLKRTHGTEMGKHLKYLQVNLKLVMCAHHQFLFELTKGNFLK